MSAIMIPDPAHPPALGDLVRARAADCAERTAIVFEGREINYAELQRLAFRFANALIASGIGPGDRVAVLARNCDAFFCLLVGAAMADVVLVPMNWRLSGTEIAYLLKDSDARLLFTDHASLSLAQSGLAEAGADLPLVILDRDTGENALPDWLGKGSDRDPAITVGPDHVAIQLYTSGTTGHPKGAMLSHHSLNCVRLSQPPSVGWSAWSGDDTCLISMPLFHIGGIGTALASIALGARMIILREFDAGQVLDHIERDGIKKLFLVPAAFRIILDHPRAASCDFSRLEYVLYGSSPITPSLLDEAVAMFGCGFVQVYGMTETSGTIVALPPEDHGPAHRGSAGRPLDGVEIAILDPAGRPVPANTPGEVAIRSGATMTGYWNRPDDSGRAFTPDGFLLSGDAGYLDDDGYLFICDRIKDMIISGGENVYAAEVENALTEHAAIAEVAIVGVPDPKWGETVHAVIVLRPGSELDLDTLRAWARERLAGFKIPRSIELVPSLPRNAAGKVLRRVIRDRAAKARAAD